MDFKDIQLRCRELVVQKKTVQMRKMLKMLGFPKPEIDAFIKDIRKELKVRSTPLRPPKPFTSWNEVLQFYCPEYIENWKLAHSNLAGLNARRAVRECLQSGMFTIDGLTVDMLDY